MPHTFGYCRGSTADSTERQMQKIKAWFHSQAALDAKLEFGGFMMDKTTTSNIPFVERTYGALLNSRLQSGDTVVCTKLGCIFRNNREALNVVGDFRQRGIRLVLLELDVDTTRPECEQFVASMSNFVEWERSRISEWTKDGLGKRKSQGLPYAPNCAPGWRIVKSRFDGKKRYAPDSEAMAYGYAIMLLRDRYKVPIDALALASHIAGKENAQSGLIRRWDSAARLDFPRHDGKTPFRVLEAKAKVIQAAEQLAAKLLAEVLRRKGHWAKKHLAALSQAIVTRASHSLNRKLHSRYTNTQDLHTKGDTV